MTERRRADLRLVPADAPDLPLSSERHDELEPHTEQEIEPIVYEGEILSDEPARSFLPSMVVDRVMVIRPSDGTVKVAKTLGGHSALVLTGWHSWWVRAWNGLTYGAYRRQIRNAEILADSDALSYWQDRKQAAIDRRHARLKELPGVALQVALMAGLCLVGALLVLVFVATVVWATGAGEWKSVWVGLGNVLRWLIGAVAVLLPLLVVVVPVWLIVGGHREGGRSGKTPVWLADTSPAGGGGRISEPVLITPSIVVTALRDMGYGPLRQSIKAMGDAGAAMLGTISIAGCGVEVDVLLPSGTSTDEVEKRRRKLAENLGRHVHELFITIPKKARTVRLWIADPGALDEPIGPSPLVSGMDVKADYEKGRAPWGENLRGEAVGISLFQRHLLITGLSNQGKTAALRALALWLAFVLNVRFYIADLKGVGDWRMFFGLAEVLIEGPTDEHVIAATEMVEWGVEEMERRLQAPAGTKFDPVIILVDEAQQAFMCPAREEYITDDGKVKLGAPYGGTKATSRYFQAARKLQNQGRAVDVLLWQGTQNPTDQNLPALVREGAHIRASLALSTESQAKMALGDKAVEGGAAPHLLRQDLDKGTVVTNGSGMKLPPGQSSITVRTHYVSTEEATEIADRAKALRNGTTTRDGANVAERDLLVDIAAVLGDETRKAADVPALLARFAPRWAPYERLDGKQLREQLAALGVKVPSTDNRWPISPELIRDALAARAAAKEDDGD